MRKLIFGLIGLLTISALIVGCGGDSEQSDCSDVESQLQAATDRVKSLEAEVDSVNEELSNCGQPPATTQATTPAAEASSCDCTQEDIDALEQQLSELQSDLEDAQGDLAEALAENETLQAEADKVPDLEDDISSLNDDMATLQTAYDSLVSKYAAPMTPQTFNGSGDEATSPFSVPVGEWVIQWSYTTDSPEYAVMYVYVHKRSDPDGLSVSSFDTGDRSGRSESGQSYVYAGPGEYFLDVGAANLTSWKLTVKKP